MDFVSEKLGKNIVTALDEMEEEGGEREANGRVEMAIRAGYSTTDWEFLSQVWLLFLFCFRLVKTCRN